MKRTVLLVSGREDLARTQLKYSVENSTVNHQCRNKNSFLANVGTEVWDTVNILKDQWMAAYFCYGCHAICSGCSSYADLSIACQTQHGFILGDKLVPAAKICAFFLVEFEFGLAEAAVTALVAVPVLNHVGDGQCVSLLPL